MKVERKLALLAACMAVLTGCGINYTTPASGISLAEIADDDMRDYFAAEPMSRFPANIAVIRVQDRGYATLTNYGYGSGRYTVITTRDVESDAAYESIAGLPFVHGVAPIGRILLPPNTQSIADLRTPAAKLRSDLLLIYSIDSSFVIDGRPAGPLSVISLGFVRNKTAHVAATVSGVLVDVRSGFVYGTAEATAREQQKANFWSTRIAIDSSRLAAEQKAFESFVDEFGELWRGVLHEHVSLGAATSATTDEQLQQQSGWHSIRFNH